VSVITIERVVRESPSIPIALPIAVVSLECGNAGKAGNDPVVKCPELNIDSEGRAIMCSAETGEDVLTVADNIQVGDINQQGIQNANNVFGEDIQVCLAREQKGLDDLERTMDITGGTEKIRSE